MVSLLNKFGTKDKFKSFAILSENPDAVKSKSNTVRLVKGKRVQIPASINGVQIPAWATLESAQWSRLTIRDHEVRRAGEETRISQVFGGGMKNVKIKVEVDVDGTIMSLEDIITQIAYEQAAEGANKEEVIQKVRDTGILKGFSDGMPLFFQQMGASEDGMLHAVEVFKAAGAVDDLSSLKGNARFHTCYDMKANQGLEVISFELGSADRGQSKTGQGFVNLVDAIIENLDRVLAHTTTIEILKQQNSSGNLSQEQIKRNNAMIDSEANMRKQYPAIWSGASKQVNTSPTGEKTEIDKYNPTNVPCGRWTVATSSGNVELDVWKTSTNKPVNAAAVNQIDTSVAPF